MAEPADRGDPARPGSPRSPRSPASGAPRSPASGSESAERPPKARPKKRQWPMRLLLGAIVFVLVVALAGLGVLLYAYNTITLPDPNAEFLTESTQVFYNDAVRQPDGTFTGTPLGEFEEQNRTIIGFDQMPQSIKDAVLAAENRDFWTDPGISISGILRAAKNILAGEPLQSGSTITQQYIKVLYLTSDQTALRKAKEILLAVKMGRGGEARKRDILQGYLNTIYFGRGAYGIQAAAQTYFGVDAKDLSWPQSVALATILNSPGNLDPAVDEANRPAFLARYQYILTGLRQMGQQAAESPQPYVGVTEAEYADALANPPDLTPRETPDRYGGPEGFLLSLVEAELRQSGQFTPEQIQGGGLRIVTTFDKTAQDAAVAAVAKWTAVAAADAATPQDPSQLHGALASVAVGSGEVVALYGGPDYVASQMNWATKPRPAGSTFKPYALIAGLRNGFTLSTPLRGNSFTPPGDPAPVNNDSNAQYGTVSLASATTHSVNTAFVDLVLKIPDGPNQVIQAAHDLGVLSADDWTPDGRIALGKAHVSPLAAANAFATLANDGQLVEPHVVREVWDHGRMICLWGQPTGQGHCSGPTPHAAVTPQIAATVNGALGSVMSEGTGAGHAADFPWPVAGKTGTAGDNDERNSTRAAWYVGYTKQMSTAVMFVAGDSGFDDLNPYAQPGRGLFYGGTYPGSVWRDYMGVAMAGKPPLPFTPATAPAPPQAPPVVESEAPPPEPTSAEPEPTAHVTLPPVEPTTEAPPPEPTTAPSVTPPPPATPAPTAMAASPPG